MQRLAMIAVLLTIMTSGATAQRPTVVLQAGLGDGHESWSAVSAVIAAEARVFAYDRPGYGGRAPAEGLRDPCTIAAELRHDLRNSGLAPPYILVGHSFGGLYQYVFAKLYPKDVAGILLVDPTHPDQWRRMQNDASATAAFMKIMRAVAFSDVMRAEFDDQARCLERIDTQQPLTIPAHLLVRTKFGFMESGAFATMVASLASDWQRLLGINAAQHVAGAGHYIHHDRPDEVVAALQAVIGEVQQTSIRRKTEKAPQLPRISQPSSFAANASLLLTTMNTTPRLRRLAICCLSITLNLFAATVIAQDATDPAALALQSQVDAIAAPDAAQVRGARIAWPQLIHEFYSRRSFRPAWTKAHSAAELLRAVEDGYADGLDPKDYHLPLLRELTQELAMPQATDAVRAQFDVLSTDALLRLGYHLMLGKVDPQTFDAQWNYGTTLDSIDAAKEIEHALAADDIYARVEALKPTHRLYVTLKRELAKYRSLAAEGGLPTVAAGRALKPDAADPRVPALRARLIALGDLSSSTTESISTEYDATLQAAVRRFQERMGLTADGVIGARTIEELNVSIDDRIRQLRVNLDRGRVLLHNLPQEFLVANIASYQLYLVRGNEAVWQTRVQVGKTYRRTPIFRSEINYLVFNPTWTVPPGIIENDILPEAKHTAAAITRRKLTVLDSSGREVSPASVDWKRYKSGYIPYTLRQDAGPNNALGRVKFMFPNAYSVYLHDTPSKNLFESSDRAFSSGCVRVEQPLELAKRLLDDPQKWSDEAIARVIESEKTQNVTLKKKVPLLLAYWTAWVDDQDRVNFRRDVYEQDALWAKGLDGEFTVRSKSPKPSKK